MILSIMPKFIQILVGLFITLCPIYFAIIAPWTAPCYQGGFDSAFGLIMLVGMVGCGAFFTYAIATNKLEM